MGRYMNIFFSLLMIWYECREAWWGTRSFKLEVAVIERWIGAGVVGSRSIVARASHCWMSRRMTCDSISTCLRPH